MPRQSGEALSAIGQGNETLDRSKVAQIMSTVLPETWTHVHNVNWLAVGFHLKLAGVDWRSESELHGAMALLERAGIVQRNGYTIRRVPLIETGDPK